MYISREAAYNALAAAVEERGEDYVYEKANGTTCMYAEFERVWDEKRQEYVHHGDGKASCLVGHAVAKLGLSLEFFRAEHVDYYGDGDHINREDSNALLEALRRLEGWVFQDGVDRMFESAQTHQDLGGTWGEALTLAEESTF